MPEYAMEKVLWPSCCSHGQGEHLRCLSVLNPVGAAVTSTPPTSSHIPSPCFHDDPAGRRCNTVGYTVLLSGDNLDNGSVAENILVEMATYFQVQLDLRHRYGHILRYYYNCRLRCECMDPFFCR